MLHQQCKQLERAKTGDALKQKILQRPQREELERRHILDQQQSYIDPSIAEKRRKLSKAMIADHLNSKISHRPGPLELIEKNILHTEEPIEQLVKEGLVTYKAANEGTQKGPPHPSSYTVDDDSQGSSEGDPLSVCSQSDVVEVNAGGQVVALTIPTSGGAVVVTSAPLQPQPSTNKMPSLVPTTQFVALQQDQSMTQSPPMCVKQEPVQTTPNLYAQLCQSTVSNALSPQSLGSSTSSLSPISNVASPPSMSKTIPTAAFLSSQQQKSDAPGKDKNKKKSKTKAAAAKSRIIKFHEYKGPPSVQKTSSPLQNGGVITGENGETNYQLAVKQQHLLQYLEQIYKRPHILPATQKPQAPPPPLQLQTSTIVMSNPMQAQNTDMMVQPNSPPTPMRIVPMPTVVPVAPSMTSSVPSIPPSPASTYSDSTTVSDMGKMKVSDLKQQLKKLNLKVSGSKQALIERLKQHMPLDIEPSTEESISGETCDFDAVSNATPPHQSPSSESDFDTMDTHDHLMSIKHEPLTPQPMQIVNPEDDIVREQQRKIEELQRNLREAHQQLEQMRQVKMDESEPVSVRLKHTLEARKQKEKLVQLEAQQKQQQQMLAIQKQKQQQQQLLQQQQQQQRLLAQQQQQQQQKSPQQMMNSNPPALNAFITPIKKENTTTNGMVFYEQQQAIPIPTLLVCVQDSKKTHQRTTSMPSIVLPITTSNSGPPPLVEASQPITLQQQQNQIVTPIKTHHIPLPQSSPPELRPIDPLPPPHYDEATKRLEDNKKLAQTLAAQNVPPLAKCSPITQVQALSKVRKGDSMTQAFKDVYEILSKNGELPDASTTPDTPDENETSNNSQVMMINPNLMFDRRVRSVVNELTGSSGVSNDAPSSEIPSSILLDGGGDLLNLQVLSPMQQDCMQSDPEETLDKLLAQAQQTNDCHTPHNSPFHASSNATPTHQSSSTLLTDFNDLELLEFPMDIEEEAYHHSNLMNHHSSDGNQGQMTSRVREMNPSLTPSLNELIQIQQQQQQQHNSQAETAMNGYANNFTDSMNNNSDNSHCSSVSHFNNETPMDFENLLSNFEIPTSFDTLAGLHSNQRPPSRDTNIGYETSPSSFGSHFYNHHVHSPSGGFATGNNHHHHLNHHHENILEFFNDDFRMGVGDSMSCEVDNLLCNI